MRRSAPGGGGEAVEPAVLMYHRVCRDGEWRPSEFAVRESVFRAQVSGLARAGFYTPRLSSVLAAGGLAPCEPGRPVILTFDDGFADTLEVALPVLRDHGFTAAVFPVLDPGARVARWSADPVLRAPLLGPRGLRALEAAGVELGSHTLTHPRLPALGDRELAHELERSREVLLSIADRPLSVLAYPYGAVSPRVKRAAREAGYVAALAVHTGPLRLGADPFEIRRVAVGNRASAAYLRLKASGADALRGWLAWQVNRGLASARGWAASARAGGAPSWRAGGA